MPATRLYLNKFQAAIESICPVLTCKTWNQFIVAILWSCPFMSREEWLPKITEDSFASVRWLEDALTYVNIRSFFNFFPHLLFAQRWPSMRLYCPQALFRRRCLFDMVWSILVSGTFWVPPLVSWFDLDSTQKRLIASVSAKMWRRKADLCRQFRDHDYKMTEDLIEAGFLREYCGKIFTGIRHRTMQKPGPVRRIRYTVADKPSQVFYVTTKSSY